MGTFIKTFYFFIKHAAFMNVLCIIIVLLSRAINWPILIRCFLDSDLGIGIMLVALQRLLNSQCVVSLGYSRFMMTSSNGNVFRVTGHLCREFREFTGPRWIPPHKGQWRGALMFFFICVWIKGWVNNREAGDLRRYCARCDVTVMLYHGMFIYTFRLFNIGGLHLNEYIEIKIITECTRYFQMSQGTYGW